jgi:hypothetical protein
MLYTSPVNGKNAGTFSVMNALPRKNCWRGNTHEKITEDSGYPAVITGAETHAPLVRTTPDVEL